MGVLASVVRITRARSALDEDGSVLKARGTDEHQALQHAERKVSTYRKACSVWRACSSSPCAATSHPPP